MRVERNTRHPRSMRYEEDEEEYLEPGPEIFKSLNRRTMTIVILLMITFSLGLGNSLVILSQEVDKFDPDRFEDEGIVTISGNIIDKNTGENLFGVVIKVKETNLSVSTNQDGWYTITDVKTGEHEIQAIKSGYGTTTKKVRLTTTPLPKINFELVPGDEEVSEEMKFESTKSEENEWRKPIAALFALFAFFAMLAILLIIYRKFYWLTGVFIVISMISFGFMIGAISGLIALFMLFSIKSEYGPKHGLIEPEDGFRTEAERRMPPPAIRRRRTARPPIRHPGARKEKDLPPPPPPPPRTTDRRSRRIPPPPPPPPPPPSHRSRGKGARSKYQYHRPPSGRSVGDGKRTRKRVKFEDVD